MHTPDWKYIVVEKPFWPEYILVEAEIELGDASLRQKPGLRITVSWNYKGQERGTKYFLSEEDLTGE